MSNKIASKSAAKISLLWLPIAIWYVLSILPPHSALTGVDAHFYYTAAKHWVAQKPLYTEIRSGFIYLPTSAALMSLIAFLPITAFAILFKLISVIVLTLGVYSAAANFVDENNPRCFFITLLITVILSQAALFEGQLHVMTTGVLLLGYAAIAKERWWQAAIFLTLALALKPTSLVLYLLAIGVYPKAGWRILLVSAVAFLLSLIAQSPTYVLEQYHAYAKTFMAAMHYDGGHPAHWATLFGAIAFYTHYQISGAAQFITRIVLAFLVYLSALFFKSKLSKQDVAFFILAVGMCYLMLFNSRTENNDYIMVAPAIGYLLYWSVNNKNWLASILLILITLTSALSWSVTKAITPYNTNWMNPSAITIFLVYLYFWAKCRIIETKHY